MTHSGLIPVDLGVDIAAWFTTAQFDLADETGRAALAEATGLSLAFASQVHGTDMAWVLSPPDNQTTAFVYANRPSGDPNQPPATSQPAAQAETKHHWLGRAFHKHLDQAPPKCDALGSQVRGIGLVMRTADCVPVLLADPEAGVVAAVHVGWRGLLAGVIQSAVAAMEAGGAGRHQIRAAIGPAICVDCYEVGQDVAGQALAGGHQVKQGPAGGAWLNMPGSTVSQLEQAGARIIEWIDECTAESPRLYSWRAERTLSRQGGVVGLPADRSNETDQRHAGQYAANDLP
ncbi:MAG: polyphenol oxidase family protein [Bifidobacteriaceae bacterium]|jgi:YfiH family protein|nr:polyphenol oxidase family protein [Bifidobacteriaceae bacterium]